MKTIPGAICLVLMLCASVLAGDKFTVHCLSVEQGQKAIVDDHLEPYFATMQAMEMSAKTGEPITGDTLAQQQAECKRRYVAGVMAFTPQEVKAIEAVLGQLHPVLQKHYPRLAALPWKFIKLSNKIEGGLPHTRDAYIVLPESACEMMVAGAQGIDENPMRAIPLMDLLLHEQIHVFQRANPGVMDDLYINLWGFKKIADIQGSPWLTKHHLSNPDAVVCDWLLPNGEGKYLWPLVVFNEGDHLKRMPMDFEMLAVDVVVKDGAASVIADGDSKPASVNLQAVPQFRKLFPMTANNYHPDEASASMFATLCIIDHFIPRQHISEAQAKQMEPVLGPLRAWFSKQMSVPEKPV